MSRVLDKSSPNTPPCLISRSKPGPVQTRTASFRLQKSTISFLLMIAEPLMRHEHRHGRKSHDIMGHSPKMSCENLLCS